MNENSPAHRPAADPLIGSTVDGRYRVVGLLGRGGMGAVYRCENIRLHGRPCAMKVLAGLGTPRERTRFAREIRTTAQLRSLHTVPVFDSGQLDDDRPYVVMELLDGRGLDDALAGDDRPALGQSLVIAEQVLTALIEAHALGIVHRDLKPANLFLVREDGLEIAKVLDFGIAKQERDAEPALTRGNASLGTPRYMAPEQFRNEDADARTDLYALGLIVYEMLVGRRPFQADDPVPSALESMPASARLAWMHLNREPPQVKGLSPPLQSWLSAMLSKDRDARPASARAARALLRSVPEFGWTPNGGGVGAGRPTLTGVGPVGGGPRWRPIVAGLCIGGLALLALILARKAMTPPICIEEIQTDPPGAIVLEGDQRIGTTPMRVERVCGEARTLRIERPSFEPKVLRFEGPTVTSHGVVDLVEIYDPVPIEDPPDAAAEQIADAAVDTAPAEPPRRRSRRRRATPTPVARQVEKAGQAKADQAPRALPDPPAEPDDEPTGGLDF